VRLDDALLTKAKREAGRRGETLTSLIEKGLRLELAQAKHARARREAILPVSKGGEGPLPGGDLNNSAALWDILDGIK